MSRLRGDSKYTQGLKKKEDIQNSSKDPLCIPGRQSHSWTDAKGFETLAWGNLEKIKKRNHDFFALAGNNLTKSFWKKHCSNFEFGHWKLVLVGKIEFPATFVLWFEFQKYKEKIENEGFWKKNYNFLHVNFNFEFGRWKLDPLGKIEFQIAFV